MSVTFQSEGYDPAFPNGSPPIEKMKIGNTVSPSEYAKRTMKEWKEASANTIKMPPETAAAPSLAEIEENLNLSKSSEYEIPDVYTAEQIELPKFPTKASIQIPSVPSI